MHKNAESTRATWQQPTVRRLSAVSGSMVAYAPDALEDVKTPDAVGTNGAPAS